MFWADSAQFRALDNKPWDNKPWRTLTAPIWWSHSILDLWRAWGGRLHVIIYRKTLETNRHMFQCSFVFPTSRESFVAAPILNLYPSSKAWACTTEHELPPEQACARVPRIPMAVVGFAYAFCVVQLWWAQQLPKGPSKSRNNLCCVSYIPMFYSSNNRDWICDLIYLLCSGRSKRDPLLSDYSDYSLFEKGEIAIRSIQNSGKSAEALYGILPSYVSWTVVTVVKFWARYRNLQFSENGKIGKKKPRRLERPLHGLTRCWTWPTPSNTDCLTSATASSNTGY